MPAARHPSEESRSFQSTMMRDDESHCVLTKRTAGNKAPLYYDSELFKWQFVRFWLAVWSCLLTPNALTPDVRGWDDGTPNSQMKQNEK